MARVLVTAAGGDLGQALIKALRLSVFPLEFHGCDLDARGIGASFVETFHIIPPADSPEHFMALASICQQERIDIVIPASEREIYRLSCLGKPPRLPGGVPVLCQPADWIRIYGDKLLCMDALAGKVPLVPYADGGNRAAVERLLNEVGFPLVVKPRQSSGSRGMNVVRTREELEAALRCVPLSLVQAFIAGENGEYSIGVFACKGFTTSIAFRRELGPVGCSWFAVTSEDSEVIDYGRQVAQASGLQGSANVQVRYSKQGVRLLEINPRFSSLVALRAACGFRDAEWSLALALGQEPECPPVFRRIRFRRFFHEMLDLGQGFQAMEEWSPRMGRIN